MADLVQIRVHGVLSREITGYKAVERVEAVRRGPRPRKELAGGWYRVIMAVPVAHRAFRAEHPSVYSQSKAQIQEFTSWLGKRSYKSRLKRLGLERLQEIARENGKKGGRPKGSARISTGKGGK